MCIHVLKVPVVYLNFKIQETYIAAELCENKEVVESSCGGHCYLNKQLADTQETDASGTTNSRAIQFEELYFMPAFEMSLAFNEATNLTYFTYQNNYSYLNSEDVFHPPKNA